MTFIETPIFTKEITQLISDEIYHQLQWALIFRPEAGKIIKGSGGLRKIRCSIPGAGKRGGIRIIYYWDDPETIYMLFPYKKNAQEDLTTSQLKTLSALVKEYLK